jgi:nucleotide-binding universal stress UspA family protein
MANPASPGDAEADERRDRSMCARGSIVCGVDGSADSQAAVRVAARLAKRLGLKLVLVHVADFALVPYAGVGGIAAGGIAPQPMLSATRDEQEEAGARLLEQIAGELGLEGADASSSASRPNGSPIWPTRKTLS